MATIYAAAPGTTHTGIGTNGDPYDHIHDALNALGEESPGSTLILQAGTYTQGSSWNSVTWGVGTASNHYTVMAENHTDSTTRDVTAGTDVVLWRPTGGSGAISVVLPSSAAYWDWRGIVFDGSYVSTSSAAALISMNYNSNHFTFQNCRIQNNGLLSGSLVLLVELVYASSALLSNAFRYCLFTGSASTASHHLYIRSCGNILEQCNLTGSSKWALQFFASNTSFITDNVVRFNKFYTIPDVNASSSGGVFFSERCLRNLVYANEFWDIAETAIAFNGGSGVSGTTEDNVAAYNTIHNCGTGIRISAPAFTNTIVKNNLINDCTTPYTDSGTSTDASNNQTDSLDPVWTDEGNHIFTLTASSPVEITAGGTPLGSPYEDADQAGVARNATTPSIGAYEYGTLTPPEPPINNVLVPGGFTVTVNVPTILSGLSVTDNNSPSPLLQECWLYLDSGIWSDIDTSGGATSN